MLIREYKTEDREMVGKCALELAESQHLNQPEFWSSAKDVSADACMDALLNQTKDDKGKLFVADIDGTVVGFVCITINEIEDEPGFFAKRNGHVAELVVLKQFQGKGIAVALMSHVEQYAKERDCAYVGLVVSSGNRAIDLYRKLNYEVASELMRKVL